MLDDPLQRRLAAILCADVVGYSRLMANAEELTVRTLISNREEVSRFVVEHGGRVVDSPGDNLLAEFPSALEACRCALEVQGALEARNAGQPKESRMRYRIGIHLGDVMVEGERIFGDGVNIAARLEGLAEPGEICISAGVHEQVKNKLDAGFQDLGDRTVKNLPDPVRVWRMTLDRTALRPAGPLRRGQRVALTLVGAVLAVIVLSRLLTSGAVREPTPVAVTVEPIRSIAVLPLDNLSGDPDQQYFTDGMTEVLIAELGKLVDLRVISRTSVMRYQGTRKSIREIASDLDVEGIIEGSVLRADNRVRITAQLIDARSDDHIWSESYERELSDILALQRDVANAIAEQIQLEVASSYAGARPTQRLPPGAQEAYLKGLFFLNQHQPESSLRAVSYLERAIELAPDYSLPYSALADTYSCSPTHAWSIPDSEQYPSVPRATMAKARSNALRALELDETRAAVHNSLALVHMFGDWDWGAAEREFRLALKLDPSRSWTHHSYALFLSILGRLDEALESAQRAIHFDPLNVQSHIIKAEIHSWRGEVEQALDHWDQARELDPSYPDLHQSLAGSFCRRGMHEKIIPTLKRAQAASPHDPLILADLAYCHAVSGRDEEARAILATLEERSGGMYVSPMSLALVHVGLGELDEAMAALERAYEDRAFLLILIGVDHEYVPLHSDARFADLLTRIGLPNS